MNTNEAVVKKNINDIIPNKNQPRQYFDEKGLKELSESIKNYGIINPILVRQVGDKYEIIAGERRYRAAKMCGLMEIPVIIKNIDDKQSAELALIENLHREDLTAVEAAKHYEELLKIGNYTQSELAAKLGISQSSIANKIRLLSLPEEIQNAVVQKQISERHARSLLDVEDKEKQLELLERIIDEKLTVKETEELIEISNTSDEDIENAIKDIMKTLNLKEEEKESDNMNDGNFFPTYDNNMNQNNNFNTTQNTNPQMPMQENVMPTFMGSNANTLPSETPLINPSLDTNVPPIPEQTTTMPTMDTFTPNPNPNPMPEFDFNTPTPEPKNTNIGGIPTFEQSQPISIDNSFDIPNPTPSVETPFNQNSMTYSAPQVDNTSDFLFTNPTPQPAPSPEPFYEVPVTAPPVVESTNTDRFTEVENLLKNNGVNYKAYSNETGHCIIIEI